MPARAGLGADRGRRASEQRIEKRNGQHVSGRALARSGLECVPGEPRSSTTGPWRRFYSVRVFLASLALSPLTTTTTTHLYPSRHPLAKKSNMVATVQQPAPAFTAQTVVGGLFKEVSLADYLGQW